MSFTATDCTLPAESPPRIFFQRNGESLYPTRRSITRLACCASTKSSFIARGFLMASFIASSVISWKTIRSAFFGSTFSACIKCHAMASPSRSSSVARITPSALAVAFFRAVTRFCDFRGITYCGSKFFSTSTPSFPLGRSRTCPYEDSTLYSLPRNFDIVFALVGDSTITNFISVGSFFDDAFHNKHHYDIARYVGFKCS